VGAPRPGWLERRFGLQAAETTLRRELVAGATTFLTMSYILLVNPVVLGTTGMDRGAVMVATAVTAGVCSVLIGLLANYPIAGAPGMGHNAFFAFTVCGALGYSWQQALAAVFVSGVLFILLATVGFREAIVAAMPAGLKHAIAAGIGLLITLLGLEWGGVVRASAATLVQLGDLASPAVAVSGVGFAVMVVLAARGIRGAIPIGLLAALATASQLGIARLQSPFAAPPSLGPTFLQMDFSALWGSSVGFLTVVFVFFLTDVFDTVGTLVGVGAQAGLLRAGRLPRAERALLGDAVATALGGALGTSTVTAYVESATGVAAGGRTGLTAVTAGVLMLGGLFLHPLVQTVSAPVEAVWEVGPGARVTFVQYPIVAPALVLVGAFMLSAVRHVPWDDLTEAIPAFLTLVLIPLTFSITDGIAFGFIGHVVLKALTGRAREVHAVVALLGLLFVLRYAVLGR
jgi:AGZA family xanthine/uracil permease-like MFS transporter